MGRVQLSQGCRATTKRKFIYNRKSPGILRSSHQRCPAIKGVLRNFAKLTGKHLCQSFFSNKVASLSSAQVLSCEFRDMSKSTFFNRTPLGDCFWILGAHMIDHARMKRCVDLRANQCFWSQDPWIGSLDS